MTITGEFVKTDFNVTYKVDGVHGATETYKFGADVAIRDIPTKEALPHLLRLDLEDVTAIQQQWVSRDACS